MAETTGKARKRPLTAKVRRGLQWVETVASADLAATFPGDLSPRQRDDIETALEWLRSLPRERNAPA